MTYMESPGHFVVFSHGFGVRKDARGLFSDIGSALSGVELVLFDYNKINEAENTVTVTPLRRQAEMLKGILRDVRASTPGAIIDLVCHSQGAVAAALALPEGIRKTIFLAPPVDTNPDRMIAAFRSRPGSVVNTKGISRVTRRDGSTTIVPASYWSERKDLSLIKLYNEFARHTELIIIKAMEDEVLGDVNFPGLDAKIETMSLPGGHDFKEPARQSLLGVLKGFLS